MSKFIMKAGSYTCTRVMLPNSTFRLAIVIGYDAVSGMYDRVVCAFDGTFNFEPDTKTIRTFLAALADCEPSEVE